MLTKIQGEAPFQVLTPAFSISPSNQSYVLNISADGKSFSPLFSVASGVTRLVSNVAPGSYYKLAGNESEVVVNWRTTCVTEGGSGGSGMTPEEVQAQIDSALTVYTPTSGFSTINGSAITDGGNLVISGGGSANIIELTKAEYAALTSYTEDAIYVITDADVIDMNDYALSGVVSAITESLSGAIGTKATKASVSANSDRKFPKWNAEGVITGSTGNTVYEQNLNINGTQKTMLQTTNSSFGTIYAPTAAGTAGQPLLSNGSGAPVWGSYKFQFISQAAYDALVQGGTVDASTIYFIVSES